MSSALSRCRVLLGASGSGEDIGLSGDSRALFQRSSSGEVGFVFQLFNLIPYLTALENVMIAMKINGIESSEARERARELLLQVGLGNRLDHRPAQLSGGEKQRVSFARALSNKPKIIFADEPTANLDSRQTDNLMDLIRQLRQDQQTTIAIVTHHETLQKDADRVIYMQDGKIV